MEDLSAAQYKRLTYEQQQVYLATLIDDGESSASDTEYENEGSEDEWLPPQPTAGDLGDLSDIEDVYADEDVQIELDESSSEAENERDADENEADLRNGDAASESCFVAKHGTMWKKTPAAVTRVQKHNIIRQRPGPGRSTKNLSVVDTFKCIFSDQIVDIIVRETNSKADRVYGKWNAENPEKTSKKWRPLNQEEMYAYIGILITMGVHHSNNEHIKVLWQLDSYPLYRATMGINRFCDISRFIRFDNERTRSERVKSDKAAAITDIWLMLNANLSSKYVPTDCVTVDEQLFPFRGRTRFTQYIPSKPAKYGIKVWWVCDAQTSYPITGQIYTGKGPNGPEKDQGQRVVRDLCHQFKGSGRNVTMDNFFTALPLARVLLSWNLSVVGTLKQNKTCIPKEMKKSRDKEDHSSIFGFSEDGKFSICSYVPKKERIVTLLSTMHNNNNITGPKQKPEVIMYYNATKGGVDNMDKMVTHYSTKRKTLRWPLAMFYNMLDVAALAAYIMFSENNPITTKSTIRRRTFLMDLGKQLSMPVIEMRSKTPKFLKHFATRSGIEALLGHPIVLVPEPSALPTKDASGRTKHAGCCFVCRSTSGLQRKTRKCCEFCKKPICNQHSETIAKCYQCAL